MREFMVLIGEIVFIALLQMVLEAFLDAEKKSQIMRFINIACVLGSLYLLLQFAYTYLLSEISTFVRFPF